MDQVWWNKVTNAVRFTENISESINSGYSVILQLPEYVPWYAAMKEIVKTTVTCDNSTRAFNETVDQGTEPGEYLISKYCKQEVRAHYRPSFGYSGFLAKTEDITLNQSILWVRGADTNQVRKWHSFITDYNKALGKKKMGGLFVIEAMDVSSIRETKGVKIISYDAYIENYDNYVFNMLAAAELKESKLFKQYLSETVSGMFPDDVEFASHCISKGRGFLENPIQNIEEIIDERKRSDGSFFELKYTEKELQESLWEAQIKILFPLIEKHRSAIITKYKKQIEPLLPIKAAYGEEFTEVSEVELGTIAFLVTTGEINVDQHDRHKIHLLRDVRNTLAHIGVVSQKEVDELFKL